jgi:hypothetical protein
MISESELLRFLKTGRKQLPLLATDDASRRKAQRFGSRTKEIDTTHNRTGFRNFWRNRMYLRPLLKASAAMFRSGCRMIGATTSSY